MTNITPRQARRMKPTSENYRSRAERTAMDDDAFYAWFARCVAAEEPTSAKDFARYNRILESALEDDTPRGDLRADGTVAWRSGGCRTPVIIEKADFEALRRDHRPEQNWSLVDGGAIAGFRVEVRSRAKRRNVILMREVGKLVARNGGFRLEVSTEPRAKLSAGVRVVPRDGDPLNLRRENLKFVMQWQVREVIGSR